MPLRRKIGSLRGGSAAVSWGGVGRKHKMSSREVAAAPPYRVGAAVFLLAIAIWGVGYLVSFVGGLLVQL